jgi:hypothetical protein
VKNPVALNNYVWAFQRVLRVDGAEVALAGPEHDGCDVHAYLVDQTCSEHLAACSTVAGRSHNSAAGIGRNGASPHGLKWTPTHWVGVG